MKRFFIPLLFLVLVLASHFSALGQATKYFNSWGISIGGGINFPYTDVKEAQPSPDLSADFLIQPFRSVQIAAGLHIGSLTSTNEGDSGPKIRFNTTYLAPTIVVRLFPFALSPNKSENHFISLASGLHVGAGASILNTNVSANRLWSKDYGSYGDFTASHLVYLAELGYQYPLAKIGEYSQLLLMAQFRLNFAQDDKVDGYMPLPEGSSANDAYNTLSVGVAWTW